MLLKSKREDKENESQKQSCSVEREEHGKKRKRECKVSKERAVENGKEKVQIKGRPHIYSCPFFAAHTSIYRHLLMPVMLI